MKHIIKIEVLLMKYYTFLSLFVFNISFLVAEGNGVFTSDQLYFFTYTFNNPSLGPIEGTERAKVLMKNGKIISIFDLKSGLNSRNMHGLDMLIDAINGKRIEKLKIEYNSRNFPQKIEPIIDREVVGGWYSIETKDFKFINNANYIIDIMQERMDEFNAHYKKWVKLDEKNYSYTYQDSKDKNLHMEGIEVTVKGEKIIKAIDVRSHQSILYDDQSFLTAHRLFKIIKRRFENGQQLSVLYDEEYGYPYFIMFVDNNGSLRTIYSRNFTKEFK